MHCHVFFYFDVWLYPIGSASYIGLANTVQRKLIFGIIFLAALLPVQFTLFNEFIAPVLPEDSESEEEMEVQHWRVQSFLQDEYLKTIRSKVSIQ